MPDDLTDRRLRDPDFYIPVEIRGVRVPGKLVRWRVEVDVEEMVIPDDSDMTDRFFALVLRAVADEVEAGLVERSDGV